MDSTYAERRRPSRDTLSNGYADDDIGIPHRGALQSTRRLQETQALLASPGPLESMLKTTTETGDIGVFSIKPSRTSSRPHTPLHPRITTGGSVLARSMSMNAPEIRYLRDVRRGLPSHRDTTSEIISLYGSNGQRSMLGSYSRSPEDPGPRSYSLTSCSSRYMSDQKSTGTWDSRSSGGSAGVLARPRSPYPYRTRLKRPGVRASSPALTLDGSIDYSRMVEVDRPSYRTIHRYYNRSYPPNPSRHPHLRNRPLDTHVARSLPGDGEAAMLLRHGSVATRPHPAWVNHARGQIESSPSDQSAGVSSITSIVQMYGSSATQPAVRQPPISRTGSFYYDYSEDFQEHSMPVPCEPVSPMPRRVPRMNRAMVFDTSHDPVSSGAASMDEVTADVHHSDSPSSPARSYSEPEDRISRLQCQSSQEDTVHAGSVDTSPRAGSVVRNSGEVPQYVASCNPDSDSSPVPFEERVASTADPTAQEDSFFHASEAPGTAHMQKQKQSLVNSDERVPFDTTTSATRLVFNHCQREDHPVGDAMEHTAPETPSDAADSAASRGSESTKHSYGVPDTPTLAARRRSNVYSLQPGLLDLKSFVQDLDDAGLLHDENVSGSPLDSSRISSSPSKRHGGTDVHVLLARANEGLEAETDRIVTYRNTRAPAVPNAITRLKTDVISEYHQSADVTKAVILAPQPVSPARQLRLRSSVSKLMKALPPLPDTSANTASGSANTPFAGRRLPGLPVLPRVSLSGSGQSPPTGKQKDFDRTNECGAAVPNDVLTRNACTGQAEHKGASFDIYGDIWDMHFGRRDDQATTIADMDMESSSSALAHATVKRAEDILRTRMEGTEPYARQLHPLGTRGEFKSSTMRSKAIVRESSAHLNSISQARGTSLDTSRGRFQKPKVSSKDLMPVDSDVRPHRGLKKRLSDFKIRLTESRHRPFDWSSSDVRLHEDGEVIGMGVPVTSSTGSPESSGDISNSNSATDESTTRGLRYKISRWMKSAKNAVNACKRLSSSTGGTSLDTDF